MLRLFLIRHGETDFNKEGRIQGSIETELNEKGNQQCQQLGKLLIRYLDQVDYCFVSPQKRAIQSSEIIIKELQDQNVEIKHYYVEESIREIHCGDWEGKLVKEIEKENHHLLNQIRTRVDVSYPSGESILDVLERGKYFYEKMNQTILLNSEWVNVLVISHGNFLRTFSSFVLGLPPEFSIRVILSNTGFSLMEERISIGYFKLIFWNNTEHLLNVF